MAFAGVAIDTPSITRVTRLLQSNIISYIVTTELAKCSVARGLAHIYIQTIQFQPGP